MSHQLTGKKAVVTGASSGIGAVIAKRFAAAGAEVLLVARSEERLAEVQAAIEADGGRAHALSCDLLGEEAPESVVATAKEVLGGIDILTHSAGTYIRSSLRDARREDLDGQWRINARLPYLLSQAALAELEGDGRILFITSIAGHVGMADRTGYCASKAAAEAMMSSMAVELAPLGIRVNAVAPGFIATQMNAHLRQQGNFQEYIESITPAGRLGTPEEVAEAALFLVSDEASFVHGQSLGVDGCYPTPPARPAQ